MSLSFSRALSPQSIFSLFGCVSLSVSLVLAKHRRRGSRSRRRRGNAGSGRSFGSFRCGQEQELRTKDVHFVSLFVWHLWLCGGWNNQSYFFVCRPHIVRCTPHPLDGSSIARLKNNQYGPYGTKWYYGTRAEQDVFRNLSAIYASLQVTRLLFKQVPTHHSCLIDCNTGSGSSSSPPLLPPGASTNPGEETARTEVYGSDFGEMALGCYPYTRSCIILV